MCFVATITHKKNKNNNVDAERDKRCGGRVERDKRVFQ